MPNWNNPVFKMWEQLIVKHESKRTAFLCSFTTTHHVLKANMWQYNKAVTLWHLIINPLWPARNVLGWRFQQPQNYIWNLRFWFFHPDGLILRSWPREERDGLASCYEHWTEGIHGTGRQQQPHSLHLPWFFSLSRFFVAGRNISISSGTFLITWTAHNAAC